MKLTPLQWTMLLHYHAIAEPYAIRHPKHAHSSVVIDQRLKLVDREFLKSDNGWPSGYRLTGKGRCLIQHICNDLPEPVSITEWEMPHSC